MITQRTKDILIDQLTATLDGEPAVIRGRLEARASISNAYITVSFAWETALRIVGTREGAFSSGLSRRERIDLAHRMDRVEAQGR